MKLTPKQKEVIATIKIMGKYKTDNNATAKKLIGLGLCEWNRNYDALILTDLGKTIEL